MSDLCLTGVVPLPHLPHLPQTAAKMGFKKAKDQLRRMNLVVPDGPDAEDDY